MGEVGIVITSQEEWKIIEWQINDFLQFESNKSYFSPYFDISGVSGRLRIDLPSQEWNAPFKYVDISLLLRSVPDRYEAITARFNLRTLGRRNYDKGTRIITQDDFNVIFSTPQFISRSHLMERQSELFPCGVLNVICTFKGLARNTVSACQFLDVSSQTEEGTGVWKLQQHLREMSLHGHMSDVILKADNQVFKAHRFILAARSPVFLAMMSTEMKESITGVVDIEDVDPHILSDFLDYLYTGSSECLTSENAAKLYTAADKYQVDVLKENCLDHMLVNVSVENFCNILMLSVQHNEEKLNETCFQYFGKHMLDIIKTCKWQTLLCENPIICNELLIKHLELNKQISIISECAGKSKKQKQSWFAHYK